tara:strand:- start:31 stop:594 length:564 start_codon:yes stop_codon:yes gene_type:complete
MTSKLKTDVLETVSGSGTIALTNQLSGMTSASVPVLTTAHMPAGSVIQTTHASSSVRTAYNGTSISAFFDCVGAITPTSTSSKILVSIHLDGITKEQNDGSYARFEVYRFVDGVQIGVLCTFGYPWGWGSVDNGSGTTASTSLLDSPATTGVVNYKVRLHTQSGTANIQINRDSQGNSATSCQEIKQ